LNGAIGIASLTLIPAGNDDPPISPATVNSAISCGSPWRPIEIAQA
jgi:hypothetical protein